MRRKKKCKNSVRPDWPLVGSTVPLDWQMTIFASLMLQTIPRLLLTLRKFVFYDLPWPAIAAPMVLTTCSIKYKSWSVHVGDSWLACCFSTLINARRPPRSRTLDWHSSELKQRENAWFLACVQTSPPFPREAKEIGNVCMQATWFQAQNKKESETEISNPDSPFPETMAPTRVVVGRMIFHCVVANCRILTITGRSRQQSRWFWAVSGMTSIENTSAQHVSFNEMEFYQSPKGGGLSLMWKWGMHIIPQRDFIS